MSSLGLNSKLLPVKSIAESGSNENGEWIKFADGTMICWGVRRINGITTSIASGGNIPKTGTLTRFDFPVTFISPPNVSINANRHGAWVGYAWTASMTQTQEYTIYTDTAVSNQYFDVTWTAIGRWK